MFRRVHLLGSICENLENDLNFEMSSMYYNRELYVLHQKRISHKINMHLTHCLLN
ncbi:MAG: hypothetical protein A4E49_00409 [Methanosaeta sp. PtaU1.Bin112]|jgi:hypothetical protein|nr:MAG: hypothetical protein A4E49_00409 [Methanosaeta sp. PtaU1.Bin112]